jgi:hypothetical protein
MRWFVQISRLGQSASSDSYCIEAYQWRAALQYARQLSRDEGSLSRFFVDVLDNGCRAIDPEKRLCYLVSRAPDDAPLRPSDALAPAISTLPPAGSAASGNSTISRHSVPAMIPEFQVLLVREEEPCDELPISYREYAFLVKPGVSLEAAEALLWSRFGELTATLDPNASGQFVQLAVFDQDFADKSLGPPLATLIWKDWRGDPVVMFPSDPGRISVRHWPELSSPPPSMDESAAPDGLLTERGTAPVVRDVAEPLAARGVMAGARRGSASGASALPFQAGDFQPKKAVPRRRKNEDLVSEVSDVMHQLHFATDVMSGAEFVLEVLSRALPSEFVLVHLFDVSTGCFVIVRASGRDAHNGVLCHAPPNDPLLQRAMHQPGAVHVPDARDDERFGGARWQVLNIKPRAVLCGGVKRRGRYLGAIEVVNPSGGGPFQDNEISALDYICEQFREFLRSRPIVVDADVVFGTR